MHRNTSADLYDLNYLEALFNEDVDHLRDIEHYARAVGSDPTAPCSHSENASSTRISCRMPPDPLYLQRITDVLLPFIQHVIIATLLHRRHGLRRWSWSSVSHTSVCSRQRISLHALKLLFFALVLIHTTFPFRLSSLHIYVRYYEI